MTTKFGLSAFCTLLSSLVLVTVYILHVMALKASNYSVWSIH